MASYFVDYENVQAAGLTGIEKLKAKDTVYIFYSNKSATCPMSIIDAISRSKATIKLEQAKVGTKNALDFQLTSFLGFMIGRAKKEPHYYIVSKDKGYDNLLAFWQEKGIKLKRICALNGEVITPPIPTPATATTTPAVTTTSMTTNTATATVTTANKTNTNTTTATTTAVDKQHEAMLTSLKKLLSSSEDAEIVLDIIEKSQSKTEVNANLIRKYHDAQKVKTIYSAIKKPFLAKMPGAAPAQAAKTASKNTPSPAKTSPDSLLVLIPPQEKAAAKQQLPF